MLTNRSMPACSVIPELAYRDVIQASDWLCATFGFLPRLRIGTHRAQLSVGSGAVVLTEATEADLLLLSILARPFAVMVRVDDVDRHFEGVTRSRASIVGEPTTYPYGERQYSCRDLGGYVWIFSQTVADVAPETWGGVPS